MLPYKFNQKCICHAKVNRMMACDSSSSEQHSANQQPPTTTEIYIYMHKVEHYSLVV